jgi:hypothetical protein
VPKRWSVVRRWRAKSGLATANYARAPVLKRFLAAGGGMADFIVRVGWNALQLSTSRGEPFDLIAYLQRLPAGMKPHEVILREATGTGEMALALRLIIQRKTPEATEATRLALRRAARSLIAAEFMILGTSLPKNGYTAKDILAVYPLRWQIGLAFKRLRYTSGATFHYCRPTVSRLLDGRGANDAPQPGQRTVLSAFAPICLVGRGWDAI